MKELSSQCGVLAIAVRDAGARRDALTIFEAGQDELPGYGVEAGADAGVPSDG